VERYVWLWIGVGGAVGSIARHALATWLQQTYGGAFPHGTLAVNVIGSFLLGALMQATVSTELVSPTLRLALGTGVLGGFTTYSTFNYETLKLFDDRAWGVGLLNVLVTLVGCMVAGVLGVAMVRRAVDG
jgi:fluoride exporter